MKQDLPHEDLIEIERMQSLLARQHPTA